MPARDIQFGVGPVILAVWNYHSGLIWGLMRRRGGTGSLGL
jgi:hypothetical protein